MDKFIPLSVPNLSGNEQKYVNEAVESEWVSTAGEFVNKFETRAAEYLRVNQTVACQSGTAAIHLSLIASGVNDSNEVIVPTLTFIAAVNPVAYVGAEPIFMDCDNSLCMDPEKLEEFCEQACDFIDGKLTNKNTGKHVKALIVVHVFGNMADMEAICEIADKNNLIIIEDATEAIGTKYITGKFAGRFAGTIGDFGAYSFNGNKIITTGGGGMVVAKSDELLNKVRYLSTQAKDDAVNFVHNEIGYNYRMTNIQAAMGVAQLEQLEEFIQTKKHNYEAYKDNGIKLLPFKEGIRSNHWFYSYMAEKLDKSSYKFQMIKAMTEEKIQTRPIWGLISEQKPYKDCQAYKIEKAKYYEEKIVNLPCSTNLKRQQVLEISDRIKFLEKLV